MRLQQFPLQTKHLRRVSLPWMSIGLCETMNANPTFDSAAMMFYNGNAFTATRTVETVGGGIFDSYAGADCSRFVSGYLRRVLESHVNDPVRRRDLRKRLSPDDLLQLAFLPLNSQTPSLPGSPSKPQSSASSMAFVSHNELQHYILSADNAFFEHCRRSHQMKPPTKDTKPSVPTHDQGCRGILFSASLGRQRDGTADAAATSVQVTVANVGDCRGFGVSRNPSTIAKQSILDPTRHRIVPLSMDHTTRRTDDFARITLAGGKIETEHHGLIDGHPHMNVSRAFGHQFMKRDPNRAPNMQKLISTPTMVSHKLHPGDVIVLTNFGVFETRSGDLSSVDDLANVVMEALDDGASADEAAGAVTDFALAFGAHHTLQVMVAQVSKDLPVVSGVDEQPSEVTRTEIVLPGPLYPSACKQFPVLFEGLLNDVERCGQTLPQFLKLRWEALEPLLSIRKHRMPLQQAYGRECGILRQLMNEEAAFFSGGPGNAQFTDKEKLTLSHQQMEQEYYFRLCKQLSPA